MRKFTSFCLFLWLVVIARGSDAVGSLDQASQMVQQLLAMPTAGQDPQGRMNPQRWQLIRDIGALGDAAIPSLEAARSQATTALQRSELTQALADIHTPDATKALLPLLSVDDDDVRSAAIVGLAGRINNPPEQGGDPRILPALAKLAPTEKVELNRVSICNAMRDVLTPPPADLPDVPRIRVAVVVLRDRLRNDSSADIRCRAACILAEFGDYSGREEIKKFVIALQASGDDGNLWPLEQLVQAIEHISGKDFGPVPMNPLIANNGLAVPDLKKARLALLNKIAAWARSDAATQPASAGN